jgi:tRNA nucleotidyltransferase (CCA-adding enzyme)
VQGREVNVEIITCHVNADFDSFASAVAAKKIYPDAKIVLPGAQNRNVREFLALHDDIIETFDIRFIDKKAVSRLIIVDTKIGRRIGELQEIAYKPGVEVFTFDHHPPTPEDVPITRDFSENVGATTTILTKIIKDKGIPITPFEATLFALGIHEDTGSLTFKTTTYEDAEELAFAMANHASVEVIHRFLNPALTPEQHALFDRLIHAARIIDVYGTPVMLTNAEVPEYVEGGSVVVSKVADIENVDVVFALLEQEDRVFIIGRSRTDNVDVGVILEAMGGGGHAQASSASMKDKDLETVERMLIDAIHEQVEKPPVAREIMSTPVRTVDADVTIKEANKLMMRYGVSGLPVVEGGKLVGLIGRREIDKAAHHGLSHAPVKGFMVRRIEPISPETPLPDVQRLLSDEDMGRVPVVDDGRVIGIISRSDVLKALGGSDYFSKSSAFPAVKPHYTRGEIAQRIKDLLPGDVQALLREIGDLADETGYSIFLVGGIVRDLLLNYRNLDVDIVVEGDAIEFAKIIADAFKARIRPHQKFGTAVAVMEDGFKIDFASARAEFYEKPAALPQVEPTSIRQDLARRDFSINAMAVSLNAHDYGTLLDFFNGQRDLKSAKIRILHNLSFVEDPTRIFRGVRFEQRFGFKLDPETEDLLKKAIEMDLIGHLSETRLRYELMLILAEEQPFRVLKRLNELGALKILDTNITIDASLELLFTRIEKAIIELDHYFAHKVQKPMLYLAALLRNLDDRQLNAWSERMKFKKLDKTRLVELALDVPNAVRTLEQRASIKNSELYRLLHPLSADALAYTYALTADKRIKRRIRYYLSSLRGVKLSIDGRVLREMGFAPSPMYNIVLKDLLAAKLDGKVETPEEEKKFVVNRINQLSKELE